MMYQSTSRRLPGITFEVEPPPPATVLPRMDIAAFVGLAACGPIDLPVPVEDLVRFRDIFGPDLPLAWDAEQGALLYAQLAPAVELFFRNGGRRCWVVRGAIGAVSSRYAVPGLVAAADLSQAIARARCEGSWADTLRVGTQLQARAFGVRQAGPDPNIADSYAVELAAVPGDVVVGDLLRLRFGEAGPRLFLAVTAVDGGPQNRRAVGTQGSWFEPPIAAGSLPDTESLPAAAGEEEGELLPLSAAAGLARAEQFLGSGGVPVAERMLFTLLVWRDREPIARLADLAFCSAHPRFWARLPTDSELFTPLDRPAAPRPLDAEVAAPRFPLAGPSEVSMVYLPIGMRLRADPEQSAPADAASPTTALLRDGIATFSADLFLDRDLGELGSATLLDGLFDKRDVRKEPLRGMHALLPIDEVTLLAVPDAALRPWRLGEVPLPPALLAPNLELAGPPDSAGAYHVRWAAVDGADTYALQQAAEPTFANPKTLAAGAQTTHLVPGGDPCPQRCYHRVRALRGGEPGPWSNTITILAPEPLFRACAELPPLNGPTLSASSGSDGGLTAVWSPVVGATGYELAEAREPTFAAPELLAHDLVTMALLGPRPRGAFIYLRVRALRDNERGPWSATIVYLAGLREAWAVVDVNDYDNGDLLAVQRALLRCCAARGDMFAILGMPSHYREVETHAHAHALRSYDGLLSGSGEVRVRALDPSEERLLSFGALYHPWLLALIGSTAGTPRAVPPEGGVCGIASARALDAGAWFAPANIPLRGVVALALDIGRASWADLLDARVNLVRRDPRGFLLLSADTLSPDPELRPINVRRLLTLLRRLAIREGALYTFQNNTEAFQRQIRRGFEQLLADLYQRRAFAGRTPEEAYQVVIDQGLNPRESLDQGRLIIELRVAPSHPLAFLTVRLLQSGADGLTAESR